MASEVPGWYLAKKAPKQVRPGIRSMEGVYVDESGNVQPWQAHYDDYGRYVGRTDYNAGNEAADIPYIHHHTYGDYGPEYPLGRRTGDHIPGEYGP